jgi:hypothetical protein
MKAQIETLVARDTGETIQVEVHDSLMGRHLAVLDADGEQVAQVGLYFAGG